MRHGRITHQANLFVPSAPVNLFHRRFQERWLATALHIGEIRKVHGKSIVQPVLFMAITGAISGIAIVANRTEAPFIVIAGAV